MSWLLKRLSAGGIVILLVITVINQIFSIKVSSTSPADQYAYLPFIANNPPPARKINIPYFGQDNVTEQRFSEMAIFWFGRISPYDNYSDVRIGYNDSGISVIMSIFDRLLWYDTTPSPTDLARWDAVTLYISKTNALENAYRFTAQINDWEPNRSSWQLFERGTITGWIIDPIPFTTTTGNRWEDNPGGLNNNSNNRGWVINFSIPFTSLGLSNKPAQGTEWKFAIVLHDRDNLNGSLFFETTWPENLQTNQPTSWGGLHFGLPTYTSPPGNPTGSVMIRNKLNGAVVPDAAVGGTTGNLCPGDSYFIWNQWGNLNFGSASDFNIQNQSDLVDWPCFSKYYVTFPLNSIPPNKVILSATLTLYHWGNSGALSGPNQAQPSYIQVYTVNQSWNENSITWNNAPLAFENITQAWVNPVGACDWPCFPRNFNVTRAVVEAYQKNTPLNLAI